MERLVKTTYLELTRATEPASFDGQRQVDVRRAEVPCPELNRFLYAAVGSDWWWYDRLRWSRAKWLEYLDRPEVETWVAYLSGLRQDPALVTILGPARARQRAWAPAR